MTPKNLYSMPTVRLKKRLVALTYEIFASDKKFGWIERLLSDAKQEMHKLSVERVDIQLVLRSRGELEE